MKITITNRLAILIRQRKINSATEFGRRMTAAGYPMSSSHASRFEKENSPGFDLKFMNAACNILQCTPNELYEMVVEMEPTEAIDPLVTFPRHAIITRGGNHAPVAAMPVPITTPAMQTVATPVVQAQTLDPISPTLSELKVKTNKKTAPSPVKSNDSDTGPSGVIFPFTK
jgi:DNA-binding Xre family transcriptional regulator